MPLRQWERATCHALAGTGVGDPRDRVRVARLGRCRAATRGRRHLAGGRTRRGARLLAPGDRRAGAADRADGHAGPRRPAAVRDNTEPADRPAPSRRRRGMTVHAPDVQPWDTRPHLVGLPARSGAEFLDRAAALTVDLTVPVSAAGITVDISTYTVTIDGETVV